MKNWMKKLFGQKPADDGLRELSESRIKLIMAAERSYEALPATRTIVTPCPMCGATKHDRILKTWCVTSLPVLQVVCRCGKNIGHEKTLPVNDVTKPISELWGSNGN